MKTQQTINNLFLEALQYQIEQFKELQYDKYKYPAYKEQLTFENFMEFILAKQLIENK